MRFLDYVLNKKLNGGGGSTGGGGATVVTGTFELSEDASAVEITHNLGVIPRVAMYYMESNKDSIRDVEVTYGYAFFGYSIDATKSGVAYKTGSGITSSPSLATMATEVRPLYHNSGLNHAHASVLYDANESTAMLVGLANSSSLKFAAGLRYRWVMIA